eukprot:gene19774-biopygen22176
MAVGTKRSAPAFAKLGWPSWGRRRAAARAAFVAKVHEEGEPPSLKELLPPPLADGQEGMLPSAARRGELVEPAPRTAAGEQAFSVWAPRVVNQIINDNVFEVCSSDEEQQHSSSKVNTKGCTFYELARRRRRCRRVGAAPRLPHPATVMVRVARRGGGGGAARGRRRARARSLPPSQSVALGGGCRGAPTPSFHQNAVKSVFDPTV